MVAGVTARGQGRRLRPAHTETIEQSAILGNQSGEDGQEGDTLASAPCPPDNFFPSMDVRLRAIYPGGKGCGVR